MKYVKMLVVLLFVYLLGCSNSPSTDSGGGTTSSVSSTSSSSSVFSPTYLVEKRFESDTGGYWASKGSNVTLTLQSIGGHNAVRIEGYSQTANGSTGVEVQWDLVGPSDLSMTNYVISFDLYIPSGHNIQYVQWSFFNPSWQAIYSSWETSFNVDQWKSYSIEISPANIGYNSVTGGFEACTNMVKVRLQFGTSAADTLVDVYLDNLVVTNKY